MNMEWIKCLEDLNMPFNIHIIESGDSIVFYSSPKSRHTIFLLDGCIKLLKVFTNGEIICERLLYKNHSASNNYDLSKQKSNYYYKATAIIKTAIVAVSLQKPMKSASTLKISIKKLATLHQYENCSNEPMISILCNRNTKRRVIQLLLTLAKNFGEYTTSHSINIPFHVSHYTISLIIGSNRTHVSQIMSGFKKLNIISYNNQRIIIYNVLKLIQA